MAALPSQCLTTQASTCPPYLAHISRSTRAPRSYEVVLPDRSHAQVTAAALLGRLYVMGASAPDSRWQECGAALKQSALSFRLRYRT